MTGVLSEQGSPQGSPQPDPHPCSLSTTPNINNGPGRKPERASATGASQETS